MFRGNLGMQKVLLTIKGNQIDGNPGDGIELVTEGRLYREENGYLIEFDESDLTGREGVTTKIQLENGSVTLSRNGDDQTHMIFSKNSVYESNFSTPLGPMRISVLALQIRSELTDERGSLSLEYELSTDVSCSLGKLDLSFKSIGEWIN
jgi:uncharacterized beta-barrel protein YwiB (DUF1934 family)